VAYRKILVGYDGSAPATAALLHAVDLAARCGAELTAAAVARLPEYAGTVDEVNGAMDDARRHFQAILERASELGKERGAAIKTELLVGQPADALIRFAQQHGCDLIVVGPRGMSALRRFLLGSVSAALVRYASCSVLVYRSPEGGPD